MGSAKWFFSLSGVILLIGALAIGGKSIDFGIDFKSGTRIKTALNKSANEQQVRAVLSSIGYSDATVQRVDDPEIGKNVFQISFKI